MNANELLDIIGETRNEYIMEAQGHRSAGKTVKSRIPAKRILLIAAIIALLVAMVGFAAIVLNLGSLSLGEFSFVAGFGETKTMEVISLQGLTGSKNYLAAQEWQQFMADYDPDGTLLKQADSNSYAPPAEYDAYLCYTEEMVEKVDELCEKYDLALLGPRYLDSGLWATCDAVGLNSIFGENAVSALYETSGYHYQNGTFKVEAVAELNSDAVWQHPITFQYHSVQKSCFDTVYINVWDTDRYEQWEYTTDSGDDLLLALSPENALLVYDGSDMFVTVSVISPQYGDAHMDRAALEAFADALLFDYSVQPVIETPAPPKGETSAGTVYYSDFADYITDLIAAERDVHYAIDQVDGMDDEELIILNEDGVIQEILTIRDGYVQTMAGGGCLHLCEYWELNPIMDVTDPNYVYIYRVIEQESDVGDAIQHQYMYIAEDGVGVILDVLMECADGTYARSGNDGAAATNWQTITEEEYRTLMGQYERLALAGKDINAFFGDHTPDFTMLETAYVPIACEEHGRSWENVQAFLQERGYTCSVGEGTYYAEDPLNPESCLMGELTNQGGELEIANVRYRLVLGDAVREVCTNFTDSGAQYAVNASMLRGGLWVPDISEQVMFIKSIRDLR